MKKALPLKTFLDELVSGMHREIVLGDPMVPGHHNHSMLAKEGGDPQDKALDEHLGLDEYLKLRIICRMIRDNFVEHDLRQKKLSLNTEYLRENNLVQALDHILSLE